MIRVRMIEAEQLRTKLAGPCLGLPVVLARVKEYRRKLGDYWRPAPLLEKLAAEGRGFNGDAAT